MGNPPPGVEEQRPREETAGASPVTDAEVPASAPQEPHAAPKPAARSCSHCGSPLARGQEWCLQCGAAARGSLENPRWRSTTAIAAGVAALALGAGAAAYAALEQHAPKRPVRTIAATTLPVTPPAAVVPPAITKSAVPSTPAHPKLPIPQQKTKLPKIPLTAPATPSKPASEGAGKTSPGKSEGEGAGKGGEGSSSEPAALELDTNAASTYNPYSLPASYFGDPSLVIDGDTATAWTAELDPATVPAMAEGVLLNLNSAQKLSVMKLVTQSPGMRVQVYGTTLSKPPESIVNTGWTALSAPRVVKKHDARIKLAHQKKAFRDVVLWISKAPAGDTATTQPPARVYVNELEVFPAS
jgi:hypothetical protein